MDGSGSYREWEMNATPASGRHQDLHGGGGVSGEQIGVGQPTFGWDFANSETYCLMLLPVMDIN